MTELNFEQDVAIDLDNLHEEWQTHAQVRYKYATEVAHLDKMVKQQNKLIEVKRSKLKAETGKLILQIKEKNPKATVQMIDAECAEHEKLDPFQKELSCAQDELIDLEYDLNMAKNALRAFDDRKNGLENELILWKRNYFATPREERMIDGGKKIFDSIQERTVKKQRENLNQKRTRGPK
jgi:hypothetical protein